MVFVEDDDQHRRLAVRPSSSSSSSSSRDVVVAAEVKAEPGFADTDDDDEEEATAVLKPRHTRIVVVASMRHENTDWLQQELPGEQTAIYMADGEDPSPSSYPSSSSYPPSSPRHHTPRNKGHEAMTYLSYIIAAYDTLPDVVVFLHAHRWTHHNNAVQDGDAAQLVRDLRTAHVLRVGYLNLRCHWEPGCPDHLQPGRSRNDSFSEVSDLEQAMAEQWPLLFPAAAASPLPTAIAQACCSQFAVSRARIHAHPLQAYLRWRDWLLRTRLTDYYSGRVWEYLWQVVFAGRAVSCPRERACYCEGFGICFADDWAYARWGAMKETVNGLRAELRRGLGEGGSDVAALWGQIDELDGRLRELREDAVRRGREMAVVEEEEETKSERRGVRPSLSPTPRQAPSGKDKGERSG
ncbi:MAG: hypothetical protein M1826_001896 [Phylliscum demangeonii]|nr:MAG: hypothetical protein M1826_001896 [Phylliscum demangeonii]